MNDQAFDLLLKQLDRIEKQNADQLDLMQHHIKEDYDAHEILHRHERYFAHAGRAARWTGATVIMAVLAKLGLK